MPSLNELGISYQKYKSVWKVGERFGISGQEVHKRLINAGYRLKGCKYTTEEKKAIREAYKEFSLKGESKLNELAERLQRPVTSICRQARLMGLSSPYRKHNEYLKRKKSEISKKWHLTNPHPKGMRGKTHSQDYCQEIGERSKKWWKEASDEQKATSRKKALITKRNNGNDKNQRGSWKASWRKIGEKEKFYRSKWEANYARYLEYSLNKKWIKGWEHEPKTFWFEKIKRGTRSYLPDFQIFNNDGSYHWVEVKGWMDDRSKTKIKRFKKYFPNEKLIIIDGKWFKENNCKMKVIISSWE